MMWRPHAEAPVGKGGRKATAVRKHRYRTELASQPALAQVQHNPQPVRRDIEVALATAWAAKPEYLPPTPPTATALAGAAASTAAAAAAAVVATVAATVVAVTRKVSDMLLGDAAPVVPLAEAAAGSASGPVVYGAPMKRGRSNTPTAAEPATKAARSGDEIQETGTNHSMPTTGALAFSVRLQTSMLSWCLCCLWR